MQGAPSAFLTQRNDGGATESQGHGCSASASPRHRSSWPLLLPAGPASLLRSPGWTREGSAPVKSQPPCGSAACDGYIRPCLPTVQVHEIFANVQNSLLAEFVRLCRPCADPWHMNANLPAASRLSLLGAGCNPCKIPRTRGCRMADATCCLKYPLLSQAGMPSHIGSLRIRFNACLRSCKARRLRMVANN